MGCGCSKNKTNNVVGNSRTTIYQVVNPQGQVLSEHVSPSEARAAAQNVGGRVRLTSKSNASITT